MEISPEIFRFSIHFTNSTKLFYKPISELNLLENYIQEFGLSTIKKIIFHFVVHDKKQYPYVHNIVLKNTRRNIFMVIFYHYYNQYNKRVELHIEQKIYDYMAIVHFLHVYNLNECLGQFIAVPFTAIPIKHSFC
jgi:hypothetical protein